MNPLRLLALAALLGLAGCGVGSSAPPPALLPGTGVTRAVEQDGRFISLVGPQRPHGGPFLGIVNTNYYLLRSLIDTRSGETTHQLYVEDSYFGGKREWNAAGDRAGGELRFVPISLNEITCNPGCSYAEEFAATLPETLLQASPQGLTVVFTAKSGNRMTIAVPAELVTQQLAALDAARARTPAAAAAPPARLP